MDKEHSSYPTPFWVTCLRQGKDEKKKKKKDWEIQAKVTAQGQNKTKDLVQT